MPRIICSKCLRPQKTCLCDFIEPIDNCVEIGILQHPDELNNAKGSAIIARLSLQNVKHWVFEDFHKAQQSNSAEAKAFSDWLEQPEPVYLLYPPTDLDKKQVEYVSTEQLSELAHHQFRLLVIDASWRKSFKMMQINEGLQLLPRVVLQPKQPSIYRIRKQKNPNSLSTVEAIYQLLCEVEPGHDDNKFEPLLTAFEAMQSQLLALHKR